jgi:hemolysin activation/secretion protein
MFRTEEILRRERELQKVIQRPEKFYIKEIIIEGLECLTAKELKALTFPYRGHWLTKDEINQVIATLRKAYKDKGCVSGVVDFSYQIKKRSLVITVRQ